MNRQPHIAILYSELAEYSLSCLKALKQKDVAVLLVHWPINPEAPFDFDLSFLDKAVVRDSVNRSELTALVEAFNPDVVLCSGWMDKDYLAVCKQFERRIPTVLALDNHWTGSVKQVLASVISPFTIRKSFNKSFVPGNVQKEYALKLGFRENEIRTGFYSADANRFSEYYSQIEGEKRSNFPKRFLFLGRYVTHKGIFDMWEAFSQFHKGHPDWELWCIGTGDQYDQRVEGERIRHFGFVQPQDMLPYLEQTGVYILPSHFEPWGVSVHEMALAGFPMILSDEIGSREAFLQEGSNGWVFESGSIPDLLRVLEAAALLESDQLSAMGRKSRELGLQHTPDDWAETLLTFL